MIDLNLIFILALAFKLAEIFLNMNVHVNIHEQLLIKVNMNRIKLTIRISCTELISTLFIKLNELN